MDAIFFNMNSEITTLGLLNVVTHLQKQGFSSTLVYLAENSGEMQSEINAVVSFIRRKAPGLIGLSLMTFNFFRARKLTLEIKKNFPGIPVLWGGIHPTFAPEECIKYADYICIGEGEDAALELLKSLESGQRGENIRNIWARHNGNVARNELRPLIQELDTYAFPRIDWKNTYCLDGGEIAPLTHELYRRHTYRRGSSYELMVSRGCPYSCSYCCNALFRDIYKDKGEYRRHRSVESVISELESARKDFPYLAMVDIEDDGFTALDEDYIKNFSIEYKRRIGLPLGLRIAAAETNEEKIRCLAGAGAFVAVIGVQASERVNREVFNRHISSERIVELACLLKKYNIVGQYHLISANPYVREEDMVETCRIFSRLPKPFQLVQFKLAFFPNTPLRKKAASDGIKIDEWDGYINPYGSYAENFPYLHKVIETTPYTPEGLSTLFLRGRRSRLMRSLFEAYYFFTFWITERIRKAILSNARLVVLVKKAIFFPAAVKSLCRKRLIPVR